VIVLVAGATGYIGARLVPLLLRDGHEVRVGTRGSADLGTYAWHEDVTTVDLDVLDADQCLAATRGVDAVVYLVHGLTGEDFAATDRTAARNVADAVTANEVGRIVYLSGLVPQVDEADLSEHIRSRLEVERILSEATATTLTLRAAVVVGAGSTSFEIVRQLSDRLVVQPHPTWMNALVQPVAVADVLEALAGALAAPGPSRSYDVGGRRRLSYGELVRAYENAAGSRRLTVPVPAVPTSVVGRIAGRLIDVDGPTVQSLVDSLRHPMVCQEDDFVRDLLPPGYRLRPLDAAITEALRDG
jgi:uncharacterized protein YbjT (DUF2867 family)